MKRLLIGFLVGFLVLVGLGEFQAQAQIINDDFMVGSTGSGAIGHARWNVYAIGGGGIVVSVPTLAPPWFYNKLGGPFGIVRITTNGASGDSGVLQHRNAMLPNMAAAAQGYWQFWWVVSLGQTTNTTFFCGLSADGSDDPLNFIGIRYDTSAGDTKFTFSSIAGGAATTSVTNSIDADTAVHRFRVRSTVAGTLLFSVDNGPETQITTNVPTTTMTPACSIKALTASALHFDVRHFLLNIRGPSD